MIRSSTLAALLLWAAPACAQLNGATELKVGIPTKGAAATKPHAEIYYLVGEVGAKETYTLNGKGPASVTLFGPDGSEILTKSGNGTVKLEVVLPFSDVFTLAVARVAGHPYSLTRSASLPTLGEATFAAKVGYRLGKDKTTRCWVIPGVKRRYDYAGGGREEATLAADKTTISWVYKGPSRTTSGDASYKLDGDHLHRTVRTSDGKVTEQNFVYDPSYDPAKVSEFSGYFCKD